MKKRQACGLHGLIGLCLAVLVLFITLMVDVPDGLTIEGRNTIGITIFFLILLITEALPLPVSCLLTIGLTPLFNVTERFAGAVVGFAHPVVFFILASFGIAGAIMNVPITKRILSALLKQAGYRIEMILLAMMITTAALSFFMSNVPTCAIMMSVALEFINMLEDGEEKKSIGKAFMIAIPVATMIGGMATPASSSLNLLAIGLLEQHTGQTVTFVQWMAIGIPLVVALIPFAWFLIIKVYKPAQIDREKTMIYIENVQVKEKVSGKEAYVIAIMAAALILWIASSWVQGIEIFTVAILACVLFFMPGINVLSWDKFVTTINWDIIFISGTVLSTANALVENNVSSWLVGMLYPANLALSTNMLVGLAAMVSFVMLLMITSAPALITVLAGPFITIAMVGGAPPAYLIIALAFCAGNCYLFPLDTVQLITYGKGYYRMTDMCKSTIFLQIAIVAILMFWIPFMGGVLGI
ncbi:MAG: DASS family sodium-coupled anion symporter [Defluviitaleaceae bacterium]|nr:DASS family sodium-coupled anion symporter [Defluviitaleaceae bacterium]